jgi:hypothetical protein
MSTSYGANVKEEKKDDRKTTAAAPPAKRRATAEAAFMKVFSDQMANLQKAAEAFVADDDGTAPAERRAAATAAFMKALSDQNVNLQKAAEAFVAVSAGPVPGWAAEAVEAIKEALDEALLSDTGEGFVMVGESCCVSKAKAVYARDYIDRHPDEAIAFVRGQYGQEQWDLDIGLEVFVKEIALGK